MKEGRRGKRSITSILKNLRFIIIGAWLVIALFPVFWTVLTSFKERPDIFTEVPKFFFVPTFINYDFGSGVLDPFTGKPLFGGVTADFPRFMANSIAISSTSTTLALVAGIFMAYALTRFKVPGNTALLTYMLALQTTTYIVFTPSLYQIFIKIGLHDTQLGLALVYATFSLPLTVWILRNFIASLPKETEEAAKLDGASHLSILFRIILPQIRTGLAVAAIFAFILAWNDFIFSLALTGTNAATFITLADFFDDLLRTGYLSPGPLSSMALIHMMPAFAFAFFIQRYLLLGFTVGTIRKEVD